VCVDGWVRTDWNLAVIIGEATPPSLGNLRGWTTETRRVGGRGKVRTRTAILQVLQRRFWVRDGAAPTLSRRSFLGSGFRALEGCLATSSGFHAFVSVPQMDAFGSFINPLRAHGEIKSSSLLVRVKFLDRTEWSSINAVTMFDISDKIDRFFYTLKSTGFSTRYKYWRISYRLLTIEYTLKFTHNEDETFECILEQKCELKIRIIQWIFLLYLPCNLSKCSIIWT